MKENGPVTLLTSPAQVPVCPPPPSPSGQEVYSLEGLRTRLQAQEARAGGKR